MSLIGAVLVSSLLVVEAVHARTSDPVGAQFQINSYTTDRQSRPAVVANGQGHYVIAWDSEGSYGTDTSSWSVQAKLYDSNGTILRDQFQVNSYTTSHQFSPSVVGDDQGNFVVAWHSNGSYGTDQSAYSIQTQLLDASAIPMGNEFQINSYVNNQQSYPVLAIDYQGNFVVAWQSYRSSGTDTSSWSIEAQLFSADGSPVGDQFQVNSYTTGIQFRPAIASDSQGNFVVVWESRGSYETDTSLTSIQGQRFDADATPLGGQFEVNSYTTNEQSAPVVASDPQGNFVVAWQSNGSDGSDQSAFSIQAQRYDFEGARLGTEFQVNSYTTNHQRLPAVAADSDGNVVVTWRSLGSPGTDSHGESIQARIFPPNGLGIGDQFQVNSYTTNNQGSPAVAAGSHGDFIVVWESDGSYGSDTGSRSLQGQRFAIPIFTDGFESGDTSAWSASVP